MTRPSRFGRLAGLARRLMPRRAIPKTARHDPGTRPATALPDLSDRLDRIERQLEVIRTVAEKAYARERRIEPGVEALIRKLFLDPEALPYPQQLTAHRFRLASQNQEDGVTLELLRRVGTTNRRFVELGSGLSGGNSAVLAAELGWTGLMVDGDAGHIAQVQRRFPGVTAAAAWITAEEVNDLITRHGCAGEVGLLSIDVDGNDYWIWNAITACSPEIVIVEYNSMFGAERAVTIPYDPAFSRRTHRFIYYGTSLAALARLAKKKNYRLVAVEPTGVNAYFIRNDLAPDIPECEPKQAFRLLEKYDVLIKEKNVDIYDYVKTAGLELIEV